MSSNILEETDAVLSLTISRTKLNFLEEEKIRLEYNIKQMEQQIHLQRHINHEIARGIDVASNEIVSALIAQNKALEEHYLRIKNENESLASSLLIHQQLMNETQLEFASSFRSYEEKIIQLRRSIQLKESYIQNFQSKMKTAEQKIIAPSNNVTLLFFNEIEELKRVITTLSYKNKELQQQNKCLLSKNEHITKKIQLLQSLALKSQLTFEELKNYYQYGQQKSRNSAPKKGTYIPLNEKLHQLSMKKLNEAHTRQSQQYSYSSRDNSFKMLVYKYVVEIQKLKETIAKNNEKIAADRQQKDKLAQNYQYQFKRVQQLSEQLNYYKKSTQDLMKIIAYKRQGFHSKSRQKSKVERVIDRIKVPMQVSYGTERKNFWTSMRSSIKIEKLRLLQVKRKYSGFYRSLSCTIDYRRMKVDEVDKYFNKKAPCKPKNKVYSKDNLNQFSMMIDSPFQDNISAIHSQNTRRSFSQWKKETKKQNYFNLTIIEENIL